MVARIGLTVTILACSLWMALAIFGKGLWDKRILLCFLLPAVAFILWKPFGPLSH